MKFRILFVFALLLSEFLPGQDAPKWLRHIAISPDGQRIAFTYKGDIYTVPVAGGEATQLTFHKAHDYMAVWSNDSKQIAFASDRYGNFDIYLMAASGGSATRLTFHSTDENPYAFSSDNGQVYFGASRQDKASHRQFPTVSQPELYAVPVTGGRINQILTVPAEYINFSGDGQRMLYQDKKGGENDWRKHHESSICRDIWMYEIGQNTHTKITDYIGEDRQPIWSADNQSMYYLCEKSGTYNIHKKALNGEMGDQQLTDFKIHPVRFLSRGGNTLCFGYDGEIYTMQEGLDPVKVEVNITTQDIENSDKIISVNGGIEDMAVSPDGKEIAFISGGEVFVTAVAQSFTKRLTNTPEQEKFITWSRDGASVVYAAERKGKWTIYQSKKVRSSEPYFFMSTLLEEKPLFDIPEDAYLPRFSPDTTKIAYVRDRRNIVVRELSSGNEITILGEEELFHMSDGDKYFRWSPDSEWLLIDWNKSLSNSEVLLVAADGSKRMNLNKSGYADYAPQWVNGGKQMLWFSNRNGLKSYAQSGSSQSDVYTMFFTQEAWDEFSLSKEEYELQKEITKSKKEKSKEEKSDKKEEKKKEKIEELTFDWNKMEDWTSRLTIHSSRLGDAVLSKDGEELYYLTRFEDKLNLWSTNIRSKETKMVLKLGANYGSLSWDDKMENLYLLSGGKISKIEPKGWKKEAIKIDAEMVKDEDAERQYMFDHIWIRTSAIFYHPDFHGVDWDQMKVEYEKYLPYLGNSYEFAEMASEMLGELNVSHAGSRYGDNIENGDATASFGMFMDYNHSGNGIQIAEVIKGGPLDKGGLDIKPGMIIEKINGQLITDEVDEAKYLNRLAGKFTLLEIIDPSNNNRKEITIKPITKGQENQLLYKRWVDRNREEVEKKSAGKLGYVHIPGMSDGPYRDIYSDMMGRYDEARGVIVDSRFNRGGDLVGDLSMFFTGIPFISYATEAKVVGGEPNFRWTKPTLALIGEAQYSDGHCFACGYSDLKIGATVGMPTPGTCSFAGWERFSNGISWGVVPISAKDINGNWMENNQTNPDVTVKNLPGIISNDIDQQLDKAIEVLLNKVED